MDATTDSSPPAEPPAASVAPMPALRVAILDRDPRRSLAVARSLEALGARVSAHLSSEGFWVGVRRLQPTVIVLEVVPPLLSAARTAALATELLPRAPGVVLYGWAPTAALTRLTERIPNAIVLGRDEGPRALCAAVEAAYALVRAGGG